MESVVQFCKGVLALLIGLILLVIEPLYAILTPRSWRRGSVDGKLVLITGGGSGIGRRVAIQLAHKGARIISWDINEKGNEETAKLIKNNGGVCHTYKIDLCNKEAIYKVAQEVKQDIGDVQILINNAGVVNGRPFMEAADNQILKTFNVNFFSGLWTAKAFLPSMLEKNDGQLVTVASIAGYFGVPKLTEYCASKAAAVRFDDSLSQELQHLGYDGISQTIVCPYYIDTGMFEGCPQNGLVPVLSQDYVANEITDAILMKTRELILPRGLKISIFMRGLLTHRGHKLLSDSLGAGGFMDTFTGRKKIQ